MTAKGLGDGTHVAAGAHLEAELRERPVVLEELELVHRRPAHGHVDRDTSAMELVGALSADLDRGGGGDLQIDLAAERFEAREELGLRRRLVLVERFALRVARRGDCREIDLRLVALAQADELPRLLREGAEQEEQEPGREGIERARVAGAGAGAVAEVADDRERRRPSRLVVEHEPARAKSPRNHPWRPRTR